MTRLLTLSLMASAIALAACSSTGEGKTYPAPYAHERTAGGAGAQPTFEAKMTK